MGRYKHGKQKRALTKEQFWSFMENGEFAKKGTHRSFLALLYYIGARNSEALALTKENFEITETELLIDVPPLKHGVERDEFRLSLKLPYVDLIVERVNKTRKNRRVWRFNRVTAWRIVKRACGEQYYPHFFRLNRCVNFLNNPDLTLNEIRQWFAWKRIATVEHYLGYSSRTMTKLSSDLE